MSKIEQGYREMQREIVPFERKTNREQINNVLQRHNLAHPFKSGEIGDTKRGEIEFLDAGEVVRVNNDFYLVQLPAQLLPNSLAPKSRLNNPGSKGVFWTVFETKEHAQKNQLIVPFVTGAPGNNIAPSDIPSDDRTIRDINEELSKRRIKTLPLTANCGEGSITGIDKIVSNNEKFFSIVVYNIQKPNGETLQMPVVYNAKSASGTDGMVFSVILRSPVHGVEPQILLTDSYRPNLGRWTLEASRGFYSPRLGNGKNDNETKSTNIPSLERAAEELLDETGLLQADKMREIGKIPQDPSFEGSTPTFYSLEVYAPEFTAQANEHSEKLKRRFLNVGNYFENIHQIEDPFTLTAVSADLLRRDILQLSPEGMAAQNRGEQMVFISKYRHQFGRYFTESIRSDAENMHVDANLGVLPVNSGIARIMPTLYLSSTSWGALKEGVSESDHHRLKLLMPYEVLMGIEAGQFDIVTASAAIKSLKAKGYLDINTEQNGRMQ